jgi:hypothetical protein
VTKLRDATNIRFAGPNEIEDLGDGAEELDMLCFFQSKR